MVTGEMTHLSSAGEKLDRDRRREIERKRGEKREKEREREVTD